MTQNRRVAVIGASGIGKHHAKWWHLEGADVCAFLGTTDDSVRETAETLTTLFGFAGHGYADLDELMAKETPEIIDICSPTGYHHEHATRALEAGCHVLCEKPLVFAADAPTSELVEQARELVDLAQSKGLMLGMCTQYAVAGALCAELWREHAPDSSITSWCGRLASPTRGRLPAPLDTWIDLGPHLLGALQSMFPGSRVQWDTVSASCATGYEASAAFTLKNRDGTSVECALTVDRTHGKPSNIRAVELNGQRFSIEGKNDNQGVYCANIVTPWGEFMASDIMRSLIGQFLHGTAVVGPEESLANLESLLRLRDMMSV